MRIDLHLHSLYSHDGRSSLDEIVARCIEFRLDLIALTDDNTIE